MIIKTFNKAGFRIVHQRGSHIPNKRKTQADCSTPQNHKERNIALNHTTSWYDKRRILRLAEEKMTICTIDVMEKTG